MYSLFVMAGGPGHPRLWCTINKTWMPGTSMRSGGSETGPGWPGMTELLPNAAHLRFQKERCEPVTPGAALLEVEAVHDRKPKPARRHGVLVGRLARVKRDLN